MTLAQLLVPNLRKQIEKTHSKEPKLYTKEEVILLIQKYASDKHNPSKWETMFFNKETWIENNL